MNVRLQPNSVKDLPEYFVPSPDRVDRVVKVLQTDYKAKLSWLEKSFPRAIKTGYIDGDNTIEYAGLFTGVNNDIANITNTDNYEAYSFFYAEDNETPLESEDVVKGKGLYLTRTLHIFFHFDLSKVNPGGDIFYVQTLKNEIWDVMNAATFDCSCIDFTTAQVYDEPQQIFDPFFRDFSYPFTQALTWPKAALRFQVEACYFHSV